MNDINKKKGITQLNATYPHPKENEMKEKQNNEFIDWIRRQYPRTLITAFNRHLSRIQEKQGGEQAIHFIVDVHKRLNRHGMRLSVTDEDINDLTKALGRKGRHTKKRKSPEDAYNDLSAIALMNGVTPPVIKGKITHKSAVNRMCCQAWWRLQISRTLARALETEAIILGLVHRHAGNYVSEMTLYRYQKKVQRNKELLDKMVAIDEGGDEIVLSEIIASSISNNKNKHSEFMARISGYEKLAKEANYTPLFLTLTPPSCKHAIFSQSGMSNPKYDGSTPKETNKYLGKVWSRIRTKLKRDGIKCYGVRVIEPMHDATPHAHFLLFVSPENSETVQYTFKKYALQQDGDEPGAEQHRFRAVIIDYQIGTATGYIAKHIAKSTDGFGLTSTLYGNDPAAAAERVKAWCSTWGIRQFQFFGGPPVTIWRELRRMKKMDNKELEEIRKAADRGNWAEFITLLGGPTIDRKEQTLKLARRFREEPGRYGEPKGYKVIGVEYHGEEYETPREKLKISHKPQHDDTETDAVAIRDLVDIFNPAPQSEFSSPEDRPAVLPPPMPDLGSMKGKGRPAVSANMFHRGPMNPTPAMRPNFQTDT